MHFLSDSRLSFSRSVRARDGLVWCGMAWCGAGSSFDFVYLKKSQISEVTPGETASEEAAACSSASRQNLVVHVDFVIQSKTPVNLPASPISFGPSISSNGACALTPPPRAL